MGKTILTPSALEKLEKDYKELIEKRRVIADDLKTARDFGDLSENSELQAAREMQSLNETEIIKIKDILDNYELVEENLKKTVITIGAKVKIEYLDEKETEEVKIVTKVDSNPLEGLISNESPLGKALIGKKKGNVVKFDTPGGELSVKVLGLIQNK